MKTRLLLLGEELPAQEDNGSGNTLSQPNHDKVSRTLAMEVRLT